jgi:hypothetical protein
MTRLNACTAKHPAVSIARILLVALFAALPCLRIATADPDWLSGYNNRVILSIDQGDITSDLTNFPVLVYLSKASGVSSSDVSFVFDHLASDANRKKIAVAVGDDQTECYVEIEKWDDANEEAWLWVKVPEISSSGSTTLCLYFDRRRQANTAHVGDPNSTAAEKVWDASFRYVSHMQDDPDSSHTRDSTSYDHDGTKAGPGEPALTTSGTTGAAQAFDGGNDEINSSGSIGVIFNNARSVSAWVKSDRNAPLENYLMGWGSGFANALFAILMYNDGRWGVDGFGGLNAWHSEHIPTTDWSHIFVTYDGSQVEFYLNNVRSGTGWAHSFSTIDSPVKIGNIITWNGSRWDGVIDELRISNVARSPAWIQAAYGSQVDDLLDYGTRQVLAGEGILLRVE